MARTIKDNKDVIQSYVFTMAKYDFSVYEKRIIYRLVELAQCELQGVKMKDSLYQIAPTQFGKEIQMPVSAILRDEKDNNYEPSSLWLQREWSMKIRKRGLSRTSSLVQRLRKGRELQNSTSMTIFGSVF